MSSSSLVYSTDQGRVCPDCKQALQHCRCADNLVYPAQEIIKLRLETKGRKGKGVTLIEGLGGTEAELKALTKTLKQTCNCGGALKDGIVEIQGNHRDTLKAWLEKQGRKVKLAGG